jgi:acetylornithine deacetylase/succinyl-diaminopimelate desuccinylase-like protein
MHDRHGRICIDGFLDDVAELPPRDRIRMRREGPSDDSLRRAAGGARLWGEPAYGAYERTTIRPALNVTGISGGYEGPGLRNAIPASARARINIRLVSDQDPRRLARLLRRHVDRLTPATVSSRLTVKSAAPPAVVSAEHSAVGVAVAALTKAFGRRPVSLYSGGTIPAVSMLQEELGATPILMGFALPDDNMHAPNEKAHIPTLVRGVEAVASFLTGCAAI